MNHPDPDDALREVCERILIVTMDEQLKACIDNLISLGLSRREVYRRIRQQATGSAGQGVMLQTEAYLDSLEKKDNEV